MDGSVRLSSRQGRSLLAAMVLGSGIAFLDSTVVNVALPTIGRELDADLAALQWTVNAYTLTLASLILLGGSLGDHLGRRRIFVIGVLAFTAASVLCAMAPNVEVLIAARALQGVGGALLTPGSLAILQTSMHPDDRARAIGLWAGLTGTAGIVGPLLGGWLLEYSWRWVFAINVPIAAVTVWLAVRHAPESRDEQAGDSFDIPGAVFGAVALGASTYALVEVPGQGASVMVIGSAVLSVVAAVLFLRRERVAPVPMVPLTLFRDRTFSVVNAMTFVVYAGLSGIFFFLVIQLQVSLGWSPLAAGLASLPVTLLMLVFSGRSGDLGARVGPRVMLGIGSLVGSSGVVLLSFVEPGDEYASAVFPGVLLLGVGLTTLVPTLTATVMASAPAHLVGIASGVNNGVSRAAGLMAVAALPAITGLAGQAYADPGLLTDAYSMSLLICAALMAAGGILSVTMLPRHVAQRHAEPELEATATAPCTAPGATSTHGH
ncbi:MAG TPA: MFS transporter [Jiangellaceae bacterium]